MRNSYSIAVLIGTARPNFLLLTPLCVFVGIAAGIHATDASAGYAYLSLVVAGAVFAHISVNMLNEYEDFRNGLDFQTMRTPFSGGSGSLPKYPQGAQATLQAGRAALVATFAIGVLLLYLRGPGLLPIGILGVLLVGSYSTHIVRWPLASLVAPGLGFGPLMVMGTEFVLTGEYTATGLAASLLPFFLVSNLLLLNQFPDVEADRDVGRRNLPILLGRRTASLVFAVFLLAAYASVVLGYLSGYLPPSAMLALVGGLAAPVLAVRAYQHADDLKRLEPWLGANVALTLGSIGLLGFGLAIG